MTITQITDLFKSGDFTIVYHDSGHACLYKGRHDYDSLPEIEDYDFNYDNDGYLPKEVELLAKALGGKSVSI